MTGSNSVKLESLIKGCYLTQGPDNLFQYSPQRWTQVDDGEHWSAAWGGSKQLWEGRICPRIETLIPTKTILEIAAGRGRWSTYLADHCDDLVLVDYDSDCVAFCRVRFDDRPYVTCYTNDGYSLSETDSGTVDFVFSFDSLVHCERPVIRSYLKEIRRVLRPGANAFLHHANTCKLTGPTRYSRAKSVSDRTMRDDCETEGLNCIRQELINWPKEGDQLHDCLSWIVNQPPRRETVIKNNWAFFPKS